MDERIIVIAHFQARTGAGPELEPILRDLAEKSGCERGCTRFEFLHSRENSSRYTFIEAWEDEASFSDHLEAPHLAEARVLMTPLLSCPQVVLTFRQMGADTAGNR